MDYSQPPLLKIIPPHTSDDVLIFRTDDEIISYLRKKGYIITTKESQHGTPQSLQEIRIQLPSSYNRGFEFKFL